MDRFFCALALCALLALGAAGAREAAAQPVFFSLMFAQLSPGMAQAATPAEALTQETRGGGAAFL